MSATTTPAHADSHALRPTWRRAALGAVWGVIAGGTASAAIIGAAVVVASLAGGGPVKDGLPDSLNPLGAAAFVPIALAVLTDALCRRQSFWLATGWRPTWGASVVTALIAPAAAIGMGWKAGVIAWVLGVSAVILRQSAEPGPAGPRWLSRRGPAVIVVCAVGAAALVVAGLAATQIGTPALAFSRFDQAPAGAPSPRALQISNRLQVDVTVLGVEGPMAAYVRVGTRRTTPFVLTRGGSTTVFLDPPPGCSGEASTSVVDLRYRVLGIERVSSISLPGELRMHCPR